MERLKRISAMLRGEPKPQRVVVGTVDDAMHLLKSPSAPHEIFVAGSTPPIPAAEVPALSDTKPLHERRPLPPKPFRFKDEDIADAPNIFTIPENADDNSAEKVLEEFLGTSYQPLPVEGPKLPEDMKEERTIFQRLVPKKKLELAPSRR